MPRTNTLRGETTSSFLPQAFLGFTLVEVMVALAVVAVALPALLLTLSQQLDGLRYLEDRTHAQWVAANRLAELRLVVGAKGSLQTGRMSGTEEMAGAAGIGGARGGDRSPRFLPL